MKQLKKLWCCLVFWWFDICPKHGGFIYSCSDCQDERDEDQIRRRHDYIVRRQNKQNRIFRKLSGLD